MMFKTRTGVALDGWHPRHAALLGDDLQEVLADIFALMERASHLPSQQTEVYIFLLAKPTGGTRPIGLFTALYRLWSKARQQIAARWASCHDRPFFAADKGRSTLDPVWRHGVRSQCMFARGGHTASVGMDARKFYESMSREELARQSVKHDNDPTILPVALEAYRMGRTVTYNGQAAPSLYASHGIIAGDSLSDALVKLYYLDSLDNFQDRHPLAKIDVFVDDIHHSPG